MADVDSAPSSVWDEKTRTRVRTLRQAAERKWRDPDVSVSEVGGVWRIRSLNELAHPAPYFEGASLEGAEAAVALTGKTISIAGR